MSKIFSAISIITSLTATVLFSAFFLSLNLSGTFYGGGNKLNPTFFTILFIFSIPTIISISGIVILLTTKNQKLFRIFSITSFVITILLTGFVLRLIGLIT